MATQCGSRMRTGTPAGLKAASEKHMATRWSSYVRMLAGRQPAAGRGWTRMKSGPASTVAPSFCSSFAMASMRSVSFTRQLAMLRSVLGPSAYSAMTASVMAASGMWFASRSMALSGQAPRRISSQFGPLSTRAPICWAASMKRMSPWIEAAPTPSIRMPFCPETPVAMAPSAMK
ncbi:hypothetical protein D9M69_583090 [compost metagenome]